MGNYVLNITLGEKLLKLICQNSSSRKSIHLMVNKPEAFLKAIRAGIAINPGIGVNEIEYILSLVEDVLVLTCEPDVRGQEYIKAMEDKMRKLAGYGVNAWVEGGIGVGQVEMLERMGVGFIVMGRYVFEYRGRIVKLEVEQ